MLAIPARLVLTELAYAAETNLIDRVRLIPRYTNSLSIDINATEDGPLPRHTAYNLAVINGNTRIADLLAAAGATASPLNPAEQLVAACLRADRASIERLLAADPGLVERKAEVIRWLRPLHQAAFLDRPDAIAVGVSAGFPVNEEQGGPLHVAALLGRLAVVKTLISLGADPNAEIIDDGPHGQFAVDDSTPLGWARYNHQYEVVDYLLTHR